VGSFVVSMARDVDDLLSVLLLARWAGFAESSTDTLPLDVAPLFESVEALEAAGDISFFHDRVQRGGTTGPHQRPETCAAAQERRV
jgi:phosphoenolpyruvate carboxylase